ncbi:uncharacterized threonine-rich GPI-anchored glycoprotein PJ4664.02-like [Haliotis rufescens]|uniref:uncharacterized threonine-rich GPI-anchored glycoprotein PJ4664.02-like n=1 Tax=Haliotis rufescens TaxID=6454 RepID=UPI00201F1103|nr:uncharacterized threonine-rich GPI-anchored glycoprotein PJ4664.02-like [Haliotis rufescens]
MQQWWFPCSETMETRYQKLWSFTRHSRTGTMGSGRVVRMGSVAAAGSLLMCCVLSSYVAGTDYLMTSSNADFSIHAVSGRQGGFYSITYPGQRPLENSIPPWSAHTRDVDSSMAVASGTEDKSFRVSISDSTTMRVYGRDAYDAYTPLPLPALGQHYVFSNCHDADANMTTVLVVATYRHNTKVDITFKVQTNITVSGLTYNNEDVLSLNLDQNQTYTLDSDAALTGTRITSEDPIAVYAGTRFEGIIATYDQLLPVKHLGQDYVIPRSDNVNQNTVIFTSVMNATGIQINGGGLSLTFTGSLSLGGFYVDGAMVVNASQPVLVMLCRWGELTTRGFGVVPPISLLQRETYLALDGVSLKVVARGNTGDAAATAPGVSLSVQWGEGQSSNYSIGTLNPPSMSSSSFSIKSTSGLAVYVFSETHLYTGGYHFPFEDTQTTPASSSAVPSSVPSLADTTSSISPTPTISVDTTTPISSVDTTTLFSSADTSTPISSVDTTTPISSVDTTTPISSVDTTTHISSTDTTPISSVDTTTPMSSVDTATQISSLDTTTPISSLDTTTPISSLDTTTPISSTDTLWPLVTSKTTGKIISSMNKQIHEHS